MKSKHPILTLLTFIIMTGFAYGQQTVTLICNPIELGDSDPTEACYFLGGEGVNPMDYTTVAELGEEITWIGRSTSDEDSIDIKMIKYERGINVFDKDSIQGERIVRGRIINRTTEDQPYKYKIFFKVNNTQRMYRIDPLIRTRNQ